MLQRIALYTTLGLVLNHVDQPWDSAGFWMIVGLFWASEHMTRRELLAAITREIQAIKDFKDKQQ